MHPRTRELHDYLDAQRTVLRDAFEALPASIRDVPPGADQWSAAGIVEHLAIVERRIARVLTREDRGGPRGRPRAGNVDGSDSADDRHGEGPQPLQARHLAADGGSEGIVG